MVWFVGVVVVVVACADSVLVTIIIATGVPSFFFTSFLLVDAVDVDRTPVFVGASRRGLYLPRGR